MMLCLSFIQQQSGSTILLFQNTEHLKEIQHQII